MPPIFRRIALSACAAVLSACAGGSGPNGAAPLGTQIHFARVHHAVGLGKTLTTKDGGQVYGFDVNRSGTDGILASAADTSKPGVFRVSVETFDQDTGKITGSFAKSTGSRNSYAFDGIVQGDAGLVTHFIVPKGQIYAKRSYELVDPVTGKQFTGRWTPPLRDINVQQLAPNQATSTNVALIIQLKKQDRPALIVSDVAHNTFPKVIHLDPNLFSLADDPQLGQYVAGNQAVIALSPDAGKVGGLPPRNELIDMTTGAIQEFPGYNKGPYHAGGVNGLAVDPNTGVAATDTELNAQVEFYDLKTMSGIATVQLPCTASADQLNSGDGIAVDPANKLFFVTEPNYCSGSQGSALVVYDESGNVVETITGFHFAIGEPPVALNPSTRTGWAFGPAFNQLQQFFY